MSTLAAAITPLWSRGYCALPYPRRAELSPGDVRLDASWKVAAAGQSDPGAEEVLVAGLAGLLGQPPERAASAGPRCIALAVRPGTVATGQGEAIDRQGYRLEISAERVALTGNSGAGLFYAAATLLQLLRRSADGSGLELPAGRIEDWPDRELRIIHYDTKHHQERLESVKDMIARAALFKINAVAWEIEDKFAYRRNPAIGAPGAFTAEELREITAHALKHHVEIIPIVQGPSHLAFVLKHPEYAHLREDQANNYMLCPSNEKSYELLFAMYDELIEATPGCRFFHVGTDEPYFLGDGEACGCRARREKLGQGGMMAQFIERCAKYLAGKGRQSLCWGEWPMTAKDVPLLPPGIINSVFQNPEMSQAYRERGIRELIYAPTQGARLLFPEYFHPPDPAGKGAPRVQSLYRTVCHGPCRPFDPQGVLIAAWDDSGLHLETFWLGWALGCAWGWNPEAPGPDEAVAQFCRVFHGPEAAEMPEVYRRLDRLARFYATAWDSAPSKRGPSYKRQWHPRFDRTVALPRVPDPENLDNQPFFRQRYAGLLAEARRAAEDLAGLNDLLMENLGRARRNRYSLEVFLSIGAVTGEFLSLLETLAGIEEQLDSARQDVGNVHFERAARKLEAAADTARRCAEAREETFRQLVATWERSRLPKGQSAGGLEFLHVQDDTKNHPADWTPDLGYLFKPSRDLDLEGWAERVCQVAAEFRRRHPDLGKGWKPPEGFAEDG